MAEFKVKTRHYSDVKEFVSHSSHDVDESSLEKRANAVSFLKNNFSEAPKTPRLVGSANGKLTKILFTIPKNIQAENGKPIWKIYENIFQNLPGHTAIVLVVQEQAMDFVKDWVEDHKLTDRFTFIEISKYIDITLWAEDPYVIVEDTETGDKYFMEPHSFPRWEDGFIANTASRKLGWKRVKMPFYFEGGNILIGDDFFLIGADYPLESLGHTAKMIPPKDGESETDLITRVYNEHLDKTRKIFYVGSSLPVPSSSKKEIEVNGEKWEEKLFQNNEGGTVQPLFHLDMFITLLGRGENGKYRVAVGDPRLGSEIMGIDTLEYALPEIFDDVAEGLKNNGFEVLRLPLPVVYLDDPEEKKRTWYFTSYNNCLVEIINGGEKTIWLPTYGYGEWKVLKETDQYCKNFFESLGFKVVMLTDYHPLAEDSGSLHCITKYLEREN